MSSVDWVRRMFIERGDLFLQIMNARWPRADVAVEGVVKIFMEQGVTLGRVLDVCCGNGRIAIALAKRGFYVVGVDISPIYVEDAERRAEENKVSDRVKFLVGDARFLEEVLKGEGRFDGVINLWTSIGFYEEDDDLNIFTQARRLSRLGALLFIGECIHRDFLTLKFQPRGFEEVQDLVMLKNRDFNQFTSRLSSTWTFYKKDGENLRYIDKVSFNIRVYSLHEVASILRRAGWETIKVYGNLATLQPFTPLTSLNLVAKAF